MAPRELAARRASAVYTSRHVMELQVGTEYQHAGKLEAHKAVAPSHTKTLVPRFESLCVECPVSQTAGRMKQKAGRARSRPPSKERRGWDRGGRIDGSGGEAAVTNVRRTNRKSSGLRLQWCDEHVSLFHQVIPSSLMAQAPAHMSRPNHGNTKPSARRVRNRPVRECRRCVVRADTQ